MGFVKIKLGDIKSAKKSDFKMTDKVEDDIVPIVESLKRDLPMGMGDQS